MKSKNILLILLTIFIYIIALKFIIMVRIPTKYEFVNTVFFLVCTALAYFKLGFRKDNNSCKYNAIQITIIGIMIFVLLTYLSGLFFGFLKNSYSLEFKSIILNSYSTLIMIVCEELIRWMIATKCRIDRRPLYIITILFIALDIILAYNGAIKGAEATFIFLATICASSVSRNLFASYVCYKVSYLPGMIMRLFFGLYIYIVPLFPDYGNYIASVLGVVFPYIIYMFISKLVQYAEKQRPPRIKKVLWYINIPLILVFLFVVSLVSGLFRYQIMAIGSGSMEPVIYRGDAVVFEKIDNPEEVHVGDILVLKHDGIYVTHRVKNITRNGKDFVFKTKGDNNQKEDSYTTTQKEMVGIVKFNVKYIGYPTLWIQALFE